MDDTNASVDKLVTCTPPAHAQLTGGTPMTRRDKQKPQPPCRVMAHLSEHELDIIDAIENPSHEVNASVHCEIEAAHPGDHYALAQASGKEGEWWLRWAATKRHLGTSTTSVPTPSSCCPSRLNR